MERSPFISYKKHESDDEMLASAVEKIAKGEILAWFQGKSGEM